MSEIIKWTLNVQVLDGPKISASQTVSVDAYDKIDVVVVEGAAGDKYIDIQPGDPGQVQFLLLSSDLYGEDLAYSVNAPEDTPANRKKLDNLQMLIGEGAVGLLSNSPKKLYFYNALGKDVSIQILVGRNAIITPSP